MRGFWRRTSISCGPIRWPIFTIQAHTNQVYKLTLQDLFSGIVFELCVRALRYGFAVSSQLSNFDHVTLPHPRTPRLLFVPASIAPHTILPPFPSSSLATPETRLPKTRGPLKTRRPTPQVRASSTAVIPTSRTTCMTTRCSSPYSDPRFSSDIFAVYRIIKLVFVRSLIIFFLLRFTTLFQPFPVLP